MYGVEVVEELARAHQRAGGEGRRRRYGAMVVAPGAWARGAESIDVFIEDARGIIVSSASFHAPLRAPMRVLAEEETVCRVIAIARDVRGRTIARASRGGVVVQPELDTLVALMPVMAS